MISILAIPRDIKAGVWEGRGGGDAGHERGP